MKRTFRFVSTTLMVAAVLSVPRAARADVIDFTGVGPHVSNLSITIGSLTQMVTAGELNWTWLSGPPDGFATNFFSYCVDATSFLQDHQAISISDTSAMASPNSGAKVAWLFNTYASDVHSSGSNVDAAALQVAIWEALYDTTANLTDGDFRLNTSGSVRGRAGVYLTELYASTYTGSHASWLDTSRGQDQVTHSVPEPATLLLVGCAPLFWRLRRGRRRS